MFDLGMATKEQCIECSFKWTPFFSHFQPFSIAMELDRTLVRSDIVANSAARAEVGYTKVWIPHVEAWLRAPVPLAAVRRYLVLPYAKSKDEVWLTADDPRHSELERIATLHASASETKHQ